MGYQIIQPSSCDVLASAAYDVWVYSEHVADVGDAYDVGVYGEHVADVGDAYDVRV